ncbi:MAG: hypothetical protein KBS74_02950 [Clostridiales bacterium]|nr:hypothetical protein [Candidatus Cacconaster stercorequi]
MMNKTGWDYDRAYAAYRKAYKEHGICFADYMKYCFYDIPEEQHAARWQEIQQKKEGEEKRKALRESRIAKVVKKTGWDRDKAYASYRKAYEKHGIRFADYIKYQFYDIPEERHAAKWQEIREKKAMKEEQKVQRERRTAAVMKATGWDPDTAYAAYHKAYTDHRIRYADYMEHRFYAIPAEEHAARWQEIQETEKAKKKRERQEQKENCICKVMNLTGWSRDEATAKIADAHKRTGCSTLEYYEYRFFEMTDQQQSEVCLGKTKSAVNELYNLNKFFINMTHDKARCNFYFEKFLKRAWCLNTDISKAEFISRFSNSVRVIYKPILGHRGFGVEALDINPQNAGEIYDKLVAYPEGVVEEYVVQHPELSRMCPASVNTLRVVTVCSKRRSVTPDGKHMDIAYATLRIGAGNSVVDNFHSGGICAAVDLATGKLTTHGTDMDCHVFKTHPMTGVTIKGFQIPCFEEAMDMVRQACQMEMAEGLIGWDIAISENGPVLIEVNMDPGTVLLSTPYAIDKIPSKCVMQKYIFDDGLETRPIYSVMVATGWDYEKAEAAMHTAKERYGIRFADYLRYRFFEIPEEEQEDEWEKITDELKKRKSAPSKAEEKARLREENIQKIMAATGWNREKTEQDLAEARKEIGCSHIEYLRYKFYELTDKERLRFCLWVDRVALSKRYTTDREFALLTRNKAESNKYLEEFLHRKWAANTELSLEKFAELAKDCPRLIYKPLKNVGGHGIEVFDVDPEHLEELRRTLVRLPEAVVEECLVQHHELNRLCPGSVNTIRVGAITSKNGPVTPDGRDTDIAYAILRMGSGTSVVDNLGSGGMCAAVDLHTGELITNAIDRLNNEFECHPYTGVKIKGFRIPYFEEAMQMVIDACHKERTQGYIGWDVAITENGPALIELNDTPGSDGVAVPYTYENVNTKIILRKYLFDYDECQKCVAAVEEKTGWSHEKTLKAMTEAWKENGTSFADFAASYCD